jgi:hypothetical protein
LLIRGFAQAMRLGDSSVQLSGGSKKPKNRDIRHIRV